MSGRIESLKDRLVEVLDFARVTAALAARAIEDHWVWDRMRGKRRRRRRRR